MNSEEKENYWQQGGDEALPADSNEDQLPPESEAQEQAPQLSPSEQIRNGIADAPVTWAASEYHHPERNGLWYVLLVVVFLGLIAASIFLLNSYTFAALIIVMAIALVVYARRPPRTIQYALSGKQGLYVGEKLYHFEEFKAFGVVQDGEHHSIMLVPTKRLGLGVSVYFPEEVGERIVDILGARLPMQTLKLDALDLLVRRLRL